MKVRIATIGAVASAAALGLFGWAPVLAAGSSPAGAQPVVTTENYTIGNGTVTGATASPQPGTAGAVANYTVGFTTPSALAGGSASVTLSSPNNAVTFPAAANAYFVVDSSHPSADQTVTQVSLANGGHSVSFVLSASVPAGSSLTIYVIGVTNPSAPGTYTLMVSTSANPVPVSTAAFQIEPVTVTPAFTATASPALVGATSTYTVGTFAAAAAVPAGGTIMVSSSAAPPVSDNVGFPTVTSLYKLSDLTTGATVPLSKVLVAPSATGTGEQVVLTVGAPINNGDELSVTASSVRNPTTSQVDQIAAAAPSSATPVTTSLTIGTSVTSPSLSISESGAGATGVAYVVGFRPSSDLPAGGTITLVAPSGTSFSGASVTIVDSTHPSSSAALAASSVVVTAVDGSPTPNQAVITVPNVLYAGDSVYVELNGVTNPPAGTYGGPAGNFTVATSSDLVAAPVPSYVVGAAAAPALATIEVNPTTPLASAQYTIGDLEATANLVVGQATLTLNAPAGTVLPGATADYEVYQVANGQGGANPVAVSGGGTASVTITLGADVSAGTFLDVVVSGVLNPGPGTYNMTLVGYLQAAVAPSTTVPPTTVPPAPASTTTTLIASPDPARTGQAITLYATVSPATNAGSVAFMGAGKVLAGCTSRPLSAGHATCTVTYAKAGRFDFQAVYSGSASFARSSSAPIAETVALPPTGYWLLTRTGAVFGLEGARDFGGVVPNATTGKVAGIAGTPGGNGYWVVTSNGYVRAFGGARFYGDPPSIGVHPHDIIAIAPTPDGKGYWLIGADGGMFSFGDARFYGSVPGLGVHVHDITGMVANSAGGGYLLVGADGGVFTFGQARFFGSLPGIHVHVHDIRAILPASTGTGYVLVGSDGGAFVFGTGVRFLGSLPGEGVHVDDIVGLALTPDDGGYFMAGADGSVYGFGDAHPASTPSGLAANLPVVGIAGT